MQTVGLGQRRQAGRYGGEKPAVPFSRFRFFRLFDFRPGPRKFGLAGKVSISEYMGMTARHLVRACIQGVGQ